MKKLSICKFQNSWIYNFKKIDKIAFLLFIWKGILEFGAKTETVTTKCGDYAWADPYLKFNILQVSFFVLYLTGDILFSIKNLAIMNLKFILKKVYVKTWNGQKYPLLPFLL